MSFKLSQLAIVLAVVTVSSQGRIVTSNLKSSQNLHHGLDFNDVLKHLKEHSSDHHQSHHAHQPKNEASPNLINIQTLNLHLGPKSLDKSAAKSALLNLKVCKHNNGDCNDGRDYDYIGNEFQQLLNELEVELDNVNDYQDQDGDLRCGCQQSSEEEDDRKEQQQRCGGNRCGKDLRCGCRPRSEDRDESEEQQLRCGSNRCGKDLRCGCGKDLRCGCRPRSEDRDESEEQQLRCGSNRCGKDLRCGCGKDLRCGCRPRSEDRDESEEQQLRCGGNRCDQPSASGRSENELKSELEKYGKKYKINEDLDAIVLDLTNFHGLLERLNKQSNNKRKITNKNKNPKDDDNFDMDYMFSVDTRTKKNKRKTPVVINLSKYENDETMVKEIEKILQQLKLNVRDEHPVRQSKLADSKVRSGRVYRNALNFVQNRQGGNNLKYLSKKQRHQLLELRAVVHKLGARSDESKVEEMVKKIVLGKVGQSESLPSLEDVDNANLPRWLHKVLKDSNYNLRVKQLFPWTTKQKQRFILPKPRPTLVATPLRRNIRSAPQYGVPFEMQVEGLAQLL